MLCTCPDCNCGRELILDRPPLNFKEHPEPPNPNWRVKTNTYNKVVLDVCADCWYRHFGREAKLTSIQRLQFERQGICPNCCVEKLGAGAVFIEDNMKGTKQEQRHYIPCENCGMGFGHHRITEQIGLGSSVQAG